MKLFADENIAAQIVDQLRHLGHDVLYPPETGLSADDDIWLDKARTEQRILVTDDKDFGELVFRRKLPSAGVVLLRITPPTAARPTAVAPIKMETELSYPPASFVVVTEHKIRVRSVRDGRAWR